MLGPLLNLLHALWWQPEEKALLVGGKMVKSFWSFKTSSIYLLWLSAYIRLLITHMSVYLVVQVRLVFPHSLSNEWMGSFRSNQCLSSRWREDLEGWGKAMKKRRELPKLRLSFQKPLTVVTGNQIPDMRLHSGPFCWTKLADNRFINSVTELYFKQEGPLALPSVTCRNHSIWLIRLTGEAHGLMWHSLAIISHCQAV